MLSWVPGSYDGLQGEPEQGSKNRDRFEGLIDHIVTTN